MTAPLTMKKPVLVAVCGNPDAGDDGFGRAVALRLRAHGLTGATLVELGNRPADLLESAEGYGALIIVDAVHCPGEKPGRLMDVDWFDPSRPALRNEAAFSTHGMGLGRQLELLQSLGMLPAVVRIIGCNMAQAEMGCAMSEAVKRSVPAAAKRITQYVLKKEDKSND